MDHKLTIALLTPAWPGFETANGITRSVYQLALGLKALGQKPVIVAGQQDAPAHDDIPVFLIGQHSWSLPQKIAARLGRLGDVQADSIGDAIADAVDEAHTIYGLDVVLVEETQGWAHRIARRRKVPVIVVLHGPWLLHEGIQGNGSAVNRSRAEREERAYASARGILAPSRNVLAALETAVDLGNKPRAVIPNALAPEPTVVRSGDGSVLFVGRFDRHKGGDTVLEAFKRLHAVQPEARLTFAGPDRGLRRPDGTHLTMEMALAALPSETRAAVSVLGQQSAAEVAILRRNHPVAVIASRYENLNYTMLEAMAAGQAIISTNVGGPAEIFEHGKTALLVPPDDPGAMAAALMQLARDPELVQRLGEAARTKLADGFAPEIVARQVVDFIAGSLGTASQQLHRSPSVTE